MPPKTWDSLSDLLRTSWTEVRTVINRSVLLNQQHKTTKCDTQEPPQNGTEPEAKSHLLVDERPNNLTVMVPTTYLVFSSFLLSSSWLANSRRFHRKYRRKSLRQKSVTVLPGSSGSPAFVVIVFSVALVGSEARQRHKGGQTQDETLAIKQSRYQRGQAYFKAYVLPLRTFIHSSILPARSRRQDNSHAQRHRSSTPIHASQGSALERGPA